MTIDRIIEILKQGEYTSARRIARASKLSTEQKVELRSKANILLAERELEWTSHGIMRSFRFWTLDEKIKYLRHAQKVISRLLTITPHVCLGFGSVLSIVREGDLMKHDDDLDIIMIMPQPEPISMSLQRLTETLTNYGYRVKGKHLTHRKISSRRRYKVDVFVGVTEGDRLSILPSRRRSVRFTDVFPPIEANMFGVACTVPRNPLSYLDAVYGRDWRHPKPGFRHSWPKDEYRELL